MASQHDPSVKIPQLAVGPRDDRVPERRETTAQSDMSTASPHDPSSHPQPPVDGPREDRVPNQRDATVGSKRSTAAQHGPPLHILPLAVGPRDDSVRDEPVEHGHMLRQVPVDEVRLVITEPAEDADVVAERERRVDGDAAVGVRDVGAFGDPDLPATWRCWLARDRLQAGPEIVVGRRP